VSGLCLGNRLKVGGLGAGGEALLSVKQVAAQLGIATATVYGLCADGRLAHVHILNAIRVAPLNAADCVVVRSACPRPPTSVEFRLGKRSVATSWQRTDGQSRAAFRLRAR
jgi:hypothetical protein